MILTCSAAASRPAVSCDDTVGKSADGPVGSVVLTGNEVVVGLDWGTQRRCRNGEECNGRSELHCVRLVMKLGLEQ